MRLLYFLLGLIGSSALYETYNGVVDGNACTALTPSMTNTITFQAPTSASNAGNIGISQLIFQAIGNGYTYAGGPIKINGVAGTYYRQCCTANGCDGEGYAVNSAGIAGECGLTWCGGDENQWQYVDYTGTPMATTGVPQNSTVTIDFIGSIPLALDGLGNPLWSISYNFVALPSPTRTPTTSETSSITSTSSIIPTESITPTPTESISPSSTSSITPTESISSSSTSSITSSSSITPSETISPSFTSSITLSSSITPSETITSISTSSMTPSSSITPSETITPMSTSSITPSSTNTASESKSQTPPSSLTKSPSVSPSGICYSVSTQYGRIISLSGGWILVATGINVTQAYGGGYISMGSFAGCSVTGSSCRCSYTQGSTVAGCSGKRNSYITYTYGATTDITYTNESPTCSYNFAGTIGVPSSSPTMTPSTTISPTSTPLTRPVLIADSATDFPSTQGYNGWYYKYYDAANVLRPMPYYGTNSYTGAGSYWQIQNSVCVIGTTLLHPAHSSGCTTLFQGNCKPTVVWNNTRYNNNTLYIVSYTASHPSIYPGTNGVKITLKYNDILLSSASPTVSIAQTNYSIYNLSSLEVSLDPLAHCDSDGSSYSLKVYQYQLYPSVTPSLSPSVTVSSSMSLTQSPSETRTISPSKSYTMSPSRSSSITPSETQTGGASSSPSSSESMTPSETKTQSPSETGSLSITSSPSTSVSVTSSASLTQTPSQTVTESSSPSSSITPSVSATPSVSLSQSPTLSVTETITSSLSPSSSITPSTSVTSSPSTSVSATSSASLSQTPSKTMTRSRSQSPSKSLTQSRSLSESMSMTASGTRNTSATSTPLYYITYYPSSSPTDHGTLTPTPLFLITPWPSNGSLSASSTPLFMKIPYPSVSPLINVTYSYLPVSAATVAVAGAAVGLTGVIATVFAVRHLLRARRKPPVQNNRPRAMNDRIRIEVSSSELESIQTLLTENQKTYRVLD